MLAVGPAKSGNAKKGASPGGRKPSPQSGRAPPSGGERSDPAVDDDVLDLSAYLAPGALDGRTKGGRRGRSGGAAQFQPGDEVLDLDALEAESGATDDGEATDTWSYDTDTGDIKHRRVVLPRRDDKLFRSASALLSQLEGAGLEDEDEDEETMLDGIIFVDDEFEGEEGEDEGEEQWDVDAAEAALAPGLRGKTGLQAVDAGDVDEVIDALGGMDTRFLDKESQLILQEEYQRKLKARSFGDGSSKGRVAA